MVGGRCTPREQRLQWGVTAPPPSTGCDGGATAAPSTGCTVGVTAPPPGHRLQWGGSLHHSGAGHRSSGKSCAREGGEQRSRCRLQTQPSAPGAARQGAIAPVPADPRLGPSLCQAFSVSPSSWRVSALQQTLPHRRQLLLCSEPEPLGRQEILKTQRNAIVNVC